jgi:hypothetical protein
MSRSSQDKSHPVRALLLLTQPTVVVLALVLVLMQWRIPTLIQATLTVVLPPPGDAEAMIASLETGEFSPSDVKNLEIHYPDFPKIRAVILTNMTSIELKVIGALDIEELSRNPEQQERELQMIGTVEYFRIATNSRRHDLRMTRFDVLRHSQRAMGGIGVIWILFTLIGWLKLYQELKR